MSEQASYGNHVLLDRLGLRSAIRHIGPRGLEDAKREKASVTKRPVGIGSAQRAHRVAEADAKRVSA
jgi:hypothetical protein